jgi:CheY-like chemotaxis protein
MPRQSNDGATVLVVDDFSDIRTMLRQWLEKRGYQVVEAEDGDEAIEFASKVHPAIILMDIGMPQRSGISATYKIRKDPQTSHIPIVAITAYGTAELHEDALKAGCVACLTKPVDTAELEALIRSLIQDTKK